MPITPFLQNQAFDPQLVEAMGLAFRNACERLRLSDAASDAATKAVAAKVIRLAQQGERDPERICRRVLDEYGVRD